MHRSSAVAAAACEVDGVVFAGQCWVVADPWVTALGALTRGDVAATLAALPDSPLGRALRAHLATRSAGGVYDDAVAFQEFIASPSNVRLYASTIDTLVACARTWRPTRLLDIGAGDGRVTAAVAGASGARETVLVDSSADQLAGAPVIEGAVTMCADALEFLGHVAADSFDLTISTFALHALAPDRRAVVLHEARRVTDRLAIVEFDVPALEGDEWLAHLAARYAAGIAEHDQGSLVISGFLMPVLCGQLDPDAVRSTWEQPIARWCEDVAAAGFVGVESRPVADFWWAAAHVVTARSD
jgi:ubiquinone/menaquinone biosynthesis C-methylase UbiE